MDMGALSRSVMDVTLRIEARVHQPNIGFESCFHWGQVPTVTGRWWRISYTNRIVERWACGRDGREGAQKLPNQQLTETIIPTGS